MFISESYWINPLLCPSSTSISRLLLNLRGDYVILRAEKSFLNNGLRELDNLSNTVLLLYPDYDRFNLLMSGDLAEFLLLVSG